MAKKLLPDDLWAEIAPLMPIGCAASEGCCESYCGEEDGWALVVSGSDAPPILETAEHDLDAVSAFVAALVLFDGQRLGLAPRNAGFDALLLQSSPEPVGIISTVCEHPLRLGQIIEQGGCASIIAALTSGYEETEWASIGIGEGMQLRVHAAFCAPDQTSRPPFFTRRLEAVRCAFK